MRALKRFLSAWVYVSQAMTTSREVLAMGFHDFRKFYASGVSTKV